MIFPLHAMTEQHELHGNALGVKDAAMATNLTNPIPSLPFYCHFLKKIVQAIAT